MAIILKWMLKTGCVMNSSSSHPSPVVDPCEQSNEYLCSKKGYGFLDWLTYNQVLKKILVPAVTQ
jgi:hypothetical protein